MDRLRAHTENACQQCGAHVTPDFARTHGDQENRVHRCTECDTMGRLKRGSAAGIEVTKPDPLNHPGRRQVRGAAQSGGLD